MQQSSPIPINKSRTTPPIMLAALIPAYNPGPMLLATIESIVRQSVHCEIFVVDDGSEPVIQLPSKIANIPIHLIRLQCNSGIANALNTGLQEILARGFEFVSRHDCGDIDHVDRLTAQLEYLHSHPEVILVGTSVDFCQGDGELHHRFIAPQTTPAVTKRMAFSAGLVHPSCMFRSRAFREAGLYSNVYPHAEDYELFFRLLKRYEVHNLPQVLLQSAHDPKGISISNRFVSLLSRLRLQLRFFRMVKWRSYAGVMQTLVMILIPERLVSHIKRLPLFRGS